MGDGSPSDRRRATAVLAALLALAGAACGDPAADDAAVRDPTPAPTSAPDPAKPPVERSRARAEPRSPADDDASSESPDRDVSVPDVSAQPAVAPATTPLTDAEIDARIASWRGQDITGMDEFLRRLVAERRDRLPGLFRHENAILAHRAICLAGITLDGWPEHAALLDVLGLESRAELVSAALATLTWPRAARDATAPHVRRIEALLDGADPEILRPAVAHLGQYGGVSDHAKGRLTEFLGRDDAVRYETVRALLTLDCGRREAVERLAPIALRSIGTGDPATQTAPVRAETRRAVDALGRNGGAAPDVAVPALERIAAAADPELRARALRGLARLANGADDALNPLREIADTRSSSGQPAALEALAEFAREADAQRFVEGLADPASWTAACCASALAKIGGGGRTRSDGVPAWRCVVDGVAAADQPQIAADLMLALPSLVPLGDDDALAAATEAVRKRLGGTNDPVNVDVVLAARRALAVFAAR